MLLRLIICSYKQARVTFGLFSTLHVSLQEVLQFLAYTRQYRKIEAAVSSHTNGSTTIILREVVLQ